MSDSPLKVQRSVMAWVGVATAVAGALAALAAAVYGIVRATRGS